MPIIKRVKRPEVTPDNQRTEYLIHAGEPKDNYSNSDNLFDDSNRKNDMWLKKVQKYLNRKSATAQGN